MTWVSGHKRCDDDDDVSAGAKGFWVDAMFWQLGTVGEGAAHAAICKQL